MLGRLSQTIATIPENPKLKVGKPVDRGMHIHSNYDAYLWNIAIGCTAKDRSCQPKEVKSVAEAIVVS